MTKLVFLVAMAMVGFAVGLKPSTPVDLARCNKWAAKLAGTTDPKKYLENIGVTMKKTCPMPEAKDMKGLYGSKQFDVCNDWIKTSSDNNIDLWELQGFEHLTSCFEILTKAATGNYEYDKIAQESLNLLAVQFSFRVAPWLMELAGLGQADYDKAASEAGTLADKSDKLYEKFWGKLLPNVQKKCTDWKTCVAWVKKSSENKFIFDTEQGVADFLYYLNMLTRFDEKDMQLAYEQLLPTIDHLKQLFRTSFEAADPAAPEAPAKDPFVGGNELFNTEDNATPSGKPAFSWQAPTPPAAGAATQGVVAVFFLLAAVHLV